jgi:hypothetical protein
MQLSILFHDDQTRAPLDDIGLVSYLSLLDNSLSCFYEPALCHIQKNSPCQIFLKKFQKFLFCRRIAFLFLDILVKIACHAGFSFFSECALHFSAAAGTSNGPADSAGIFTEIDPVKGRFCRSRANAESIGFLTIRLSPALHEFPAIQSMLWHVNLPFPAANLWNWGPLFLGDQLQVLRWNSQNSF